MSDIELELPQDTNKDVLIVFCENGSVDVRCRECNHTSILTTKEGSD